MIYLDTSAFLKLYIREQGSELVDRIVRSQDHPLPVWDVLTAELVNALRLKVFRGDLAPAESDRLIACYDDRLRRGQYYVPEIARDRLLSKVRELSRQTPRLGCRTMDIYHVACASQIGATLFVTFDERQRRLADHAGLELGSTK